jgi:serine/threonine protein kinase/tetratricopeptide (TPR) repeat protein
VIMNREQSPRGHAVSPAEVGSPSTPVGGRDRGAADTGWNLLYGLLALQNNFIDRDTLVAAFGTWVTDKSTPLGAILLARGALDGPRHALVEALVGEHLKVHRGNPELSLAALAVGVSTRESLKKLGDAGLDASLLHAGADTADMSASGSETLIPFEPGTSSAHGQRFRVLRPHAQGGLGAVFVALDSELNREVALKEILDRHADNQANRARFLMEAEVTARLEHPGIVPVYGLGTYADGRPYYAMRFIRGDSLKEAIAAFHAARGRVTAGSPGEPGCVSAGSRSPKTRGADATPLALRKLLRRFLDVCNAIDYAHSRGILHRDIKPGNVIVGRFGETLVVDWGLAKPIGHGESSKADDERTLWPSFSSGSAATLHGTALGTPAYMSPEQAAGAIDRLGPRSDVYSLGATLYSLLTGSPPFGGVELDEMLRKVSTGDFASPRRVDPAIDRALEAICLKAMELRPEDRYETPRALADDIERWIADEPVAAFPESLRSRLARWSRRNRAWVRAGAAAILVVLVTTGVFAVQQSRSAARERLAREREHDAAERERTAHALAQSRLGQVEKANDLLADIFEDINPREGTKAGQTLNEILSDRLGVAAKQIDGAQIGDPLTVAKIQIALGKALLNLGSASTAMTLFERARKTRFDRLGPNDERTLDASSHLAHSYMELGRSAEAAAISEETLKVQRTKLGPSHQETLNSLAILSLSYGRLGRVDEAIALAQEALKFQTEKDGPDHPYTLTSRNNLASHYAKAGRYPEAIAIHEETLRRRAARLGADHPDTLNSRFNLAQTYADSGRLAEATKIHEETLALRTAKLGASHPNTLNTRNDLAQTYHEAGRTTEAISLQEATVRLATAKLGPENADTLLYRSNLGSYLSRGGRMAEAIPMLEEALKLETVKLGAENPETRRSRTSLALVYESLGRWSAAETLRRDNLEYTRKSAKPGSPNLANQLASLAANLLRQSKWTAAEPTLRECLAIREKTSPDDWSTFNSKSQLGGALLGQGKFAEAEPLVIQGYAGMKAREQTMPVVALPRLAEAAERGIRLYAGWSKPDKLVEWKSHAGLGDLPGQVFAR